MVLQKFSYEYKDWGIVILTVVDISSKVQDFRLNSLSSGDGHKLCASVRVSKDYKPDGPSNKVYFKYEKDVVTICYNDESGNVYKTTLPENDPRVPCLFYDSKNKTARN